MNKLKLFSLFAAVMFAASMWGQAGETEGPWTWMDMRSGCCDRTVNYSIAFDGLNNSHWGNISFWNDADGIGYTVNGTSPNQQKNGVFSTYFIDQNLESYSKKVLTWKFKVGSKDTKHYSNTALYALQGTWQQINALTVDFTEEYNNQAGSSYLIGRYRNTSYNKAYTGEITKTFEFNNYQGSSATTKSWCLLLTHVVSSGDGMSDIHEWGAFQSVSASWSTVYYSTISFDKNGGQGSMSSMSDKSGTFNLSANAFTKTGYSFGGWATSNSGAVAYADKASYTVNQGNRGPKTLYAKWNANKYTVTLDLQGGQTGSTSVEATYDAAMPAMTVPTRKGFTFAGYYDAVTGGTKYYNADGTSAKNWNKASDATLYARWTIDPMTNVTYLDSLNQTIVQEVVAFNRPEAPEVAGFTFVRWEVVEGPLSEGITLQAVYAENEPSGAPKKQVGKFTLIRRGDKNEYILQTAK